MRIPVLLRSAVLLALCISPVLAAEQFQAPTEDELKMTSDPKAPGADAVYLYYEEIDNDPLHYQSIYARIKVLTEKGKELATVEIPYLRGTWKVEAVSGRTIHPDGTIYPLTVKPEDLLGEQMGKLEIKRKVFTLPNVEVGSILEYRFDLHYDDDEFTSPSWEIQRPYFVHKAHYVFTPFEQFMPNATSMATSRYLTDARGRVINRLIWWKLLPPGADIKTDVSGHFTVDVTDVPPVPDEDWMPPISSYLYRVFFYYTAAFTPNEFWLEEAKYWSKNVDHFAEPTKAIHEAVNGLISPSDSDEVKARKLYAAVQALDNTDFSRAKSASEMKELKIKEAKRAEDTWAQKSGSSDDIAMLYLAMLRAAGLTAYAMKTADRSERMFDPSYMDFDQLTDMMVVLSIGGKETFLDPGEKMCPFGMLSWRDADTYGIRESAQGLGLGRTPPPNYLQNTTERTAQIELNEHGGITSGPCTIVMTGQVALHWRQMALENDMTEVKKAFDRELESLVPDGVEAHLDHFLGIDQPDSNLIAVVQLTGSLGTPMAKRLLLPGFFFETRGRVPFVKQEKRMEAVDMHYGNRVIEEVDYTLPAGMSVEGAPPDNKFSWEGHMLYFAKSQATPGKLTVVHTVVRGFDTAKPEEYQDLRSFYQKMAAADQEQLVLTETTAAKVASTN
jgi:hypothetical protein